MAMNLTTRSALVTGVSRRKGIGFAIASRLLSEGAAVFIQSWPQHDRDQPWGGDPEGIEAVLADLGALGGPLHHAEVDLADPLAPSALVGKARAALGRLDTLIVNHARSSSGSLTDVTAGELDMSWAVNARATLLLIQSFAVGREARSPGRVVVMTSGQHLGPMPGEIAYVVSKSAVLQSLATIADELAEQGVMVNAVNPGATDTGWATPEVFEAVSRRFPDGSWGQADAAARLVAWLVSDEAAWLTGQVINSEGGFRR